VVGCGNDDLTSSSEGAASSGAIKEKSGSRVLRKGSAVVDRVNAFSSSIVSNEKSYGPMGVVMTLLSYVIGLAVVLHIGAVAGRMWSERHTPVSEMT